MSDTTLFALVLDRMDGVGRVTAGRLLGHFATYEALLQYPREQVLARVKGAPRADVLVARLFDRTAMDALFNEAARALSRLTERRVEILTMRDAAWPRGLADLPRGSRPFMLHAYGHVEVLARPIVAFFGRPPVAPEAFEQAQALTRHVLPHGIAPATGAAHGFDVVIHKLCHAGPTLQPSLLVARAGMAKTPPPLRPVVSAAARAGGLFLSPFALEHGPYEHDDKERALVQAALARACTFFAPQPDTPEWQALTWAVDAGRPVFGLAAADHPLPPSVHPLQKPVDFDWVLAATRAG